MLCIIIVQLVNDVCTFLHVVQERSWGSSILSKFMEQTYRFGLASIGGGKQYYVLQ